MTQEPTLFGLRINAITMAEVVQLCNDSLRLRHRTLVGVVNAAKVVNAQREHELRKSLLECDVLVADGQSVVWASRLLRNPLPERVAGIDLFERLLGLADSENRSIYLLGATSTVLAELQVRTKQRYPGLTIAGAHDGYFRPYESAAIAADIRASGADMLFLGMPSPKKEIFLAEYGTKLDVPVLHGVGGSFDVLAGITKRAPVVWQRLGMEWLYRLLQEPSRLWRRYLTTNSRFVALTLKELVRTTPDYRASERIQSMQASHVNDDRISST